MSLLHKSVTSREALLSAAKEITYGQGLSALSIRAVAAKCGVAVGSIYNYFPTKADLIAAVIEAFWQSVVHRERCVPMPGESFPTFVGRLYGNLAHNLVDFRSGWLVQISALSAQERQRGRELEARCFDHMKRGLEAALLSSGTTGPLLMCDEDRAAFVQFVFSSLLSLLRCGAPDCAYFQRVLEVLLP